MKLNWVIDMKLLMKVLATSLTLGLLVACGPVYQTFYHYRAPADREGQRCLNECIHIQENCKGQCRQQRTSCEQQHAMTDMMHTMLETKQKIEDRHHDHPRDTSYQCRSDADACETECTTPYNNCYTNCGGEVIIENRCVYGCE
jgi:hypothetical protein